MEEKIKALLENKEFAAKLAKCVDVASAKALFAEYGAELAEEQIKNLLGGELSDEALADVAGGYIPEQHGVKTEKHEKPPKPPKGVTYIA